MKAVCKVDALQGSSFGNHAAAEAAETALLVLQRCPAPPALLRTRMVGRQQGASSTHLRMLEKGRRPRPSTLTNATSSGAIFSVGASSRTAAHHGAGREEECAEEGCWRGSVLRRAAGGGVC